MACLLMSLMACGRELVRTETVEVEVPAVQPLDPVLTTVAAEPAPPPRHCRDASGRATVCNRHLVDAYEAVRAWGRGLADQVRKIAGLQPPKEPSP